MIPIPTPAPTAPRPPPIPIPRPALTPAAWWSMVVNTVESPLGSMLRDSATEVDGGQGGEDECLQRRHKAKLEEIDGHSGRQREPPKPAGPDDHGQTARHEQDDHVAGEDVREKSDGQRDQPHEQRDDLEGSDQKQDRPADAGRNQALEVAEESVGAEALPVEREERNQREHERDR